MMNNETLGKIMKGLTICLAFVIFLNPTVSYALCFDCRGAVSLLDTEIWKKAERKFDEKLNEEFIGLEKFIIHEMWEKTILPILMMSADQFTAVAMQQVMIIGTFIDAQQQLEAQQLLQELHARAHKDYHPSEGMCTFGTAMKALAASDVRSDFTAYALSQRSQDRQMGAMQSSSAYGNDIDKQYRIGQFREKYCNVKDRSSALAGRTGGNALDSICPKMDWKAPATFKPEQRTRINKDIDYFTTIDAPWTLNVNFTNDVIVDEDATPKIHNEDEEDVLALGSHLFANELFARPPSKSLEYMPGQPLTNMQQAFMDMRAIIAKRSVAEASYNAIAGAKSEGVMALDHEGQPVTKSGSTEQLPMRSRDFLEAVVANLGVGSTETLKVLGDNPSYNAQMEILTKKIFQSPDFYTNLYDKPVNVKRKAVTLQAIKMMQKFDMLKSMLRGEASNSILLELTVVELQKEIENQIRSLDVSAR